MRLLVVGCAVALATGVFAARADACSCGYGGPRAQLRSADGAFVGRLIAKRPRNREAVYVFSIERAVKGTFGSVAEVIAPSNGASCGIGARPGSRIGLFVRREGPYLRSSLCEQVDAEDLIAAAKPLPKPNGRPPASSSSAAKRTGCGRWRSTRAAEHSPTVGRVARRSFSQRVQAAASR